MGLERACDINGGEPQPERSHVGTEAAAAVQSLPQKPKQATGHQCENTMKPRGGAVDEATKGEEPMQRSKA